jgi:O-antigen ligase
VALVALAVFAVTSIFARARYGFKINGVLGWMLVFFLLWSVMSISWSIDPVLTFRRLGALIIFCLSAVATVRHFPINFLPFCAFLATSSYLLLGVVTEISLGTFSPISAGYRFAGTVHPNVQGINCAIMLLSAAALVSSTKRRKAVLILAVCTAFLALILTKSRASFAAALFALAVFWGLSSSKSKYWTIILSIVWVLCFAYIFLGTDLVTTMESWLHLGKESGDLGTLTGRIPIWKELLEYIGKRPLHGYGFNSFWGARHIQEFSNTMGIGLIGADSAYLDLLLNLGLVGAVIYVLIVCLGIKNALIYYKRTKDGGYGFLFMLLVFCAIQGFFESGIIQMSSLGSFLFICSLLHLASRKSRALA